MESGGIKIKKGEMGEILLLCGRILDSYQHVIYAILSEQLIDHSAASCVDNVLNLETTPFFDL